MQQQKNTRRGFTQRCFPKGFTLIELLVVALIIGILAAVAVPQYQKSVLKSRFSKLMPAAKSLATANEVFYLANGFYSQRPNQLDVGSDTDNLPDGSRILLSDDDIVSFVRLSNTDVPNARYVVYQKHSVNFADTTMCEAQKDDEKAKWICEKGLNGQPIEVGNSGGDRDWNAYLLTGVLGAGNTFGELAADGCTYAKPSDITTSYNKSATAMCVNGTWKYAWSGSGKKTVFGWGEQCQAVEGEEYKCAGNTYNNTLANCLGDTENACTGSTFSGNNSYCTGNEENACNASIFNGPMAKCHGYAENACAGSTFQAGSYCIPRVAGGCDNVLYGTNPNHTGEGARAIGSCFDLSNFCPNGVPLQGDGGWNATNQAYSILGWKGGYCNPNYMVGGECPAGSPTTADSEIRQTAAGWNGGYCDPLYNGTATSSISGTANTCPSGSPKKDGGTW